MIQKTVIVSGLSTYGKFIEVAYKVDHYKIKDIIKELGGSGLVFKRLSRHHNIKGPKVYLSFLYSK